MNYLYYNKDTKFMMIMKDRKDLKNNEDYPYFEVVEIIIKQSHEEMTIYKIGDTTTFRRSNIITSSENLEELRDRAMLEML